MIWHTDGKHLNFWHITSLIWEVKEFSQWGVTWRQTGKRSKVSYRNPLYLDWNVGQEQRETLTLTAPQEQGPLSSHWVIQFSSMYGKNEIHVKVAGPYWWQTELFPWAQHTVDEVSLECTLEYKVMSFHESSHSGLVHFLYLCNWTVEVSWWWHWLCCLIPELCRPLHI